MPESLQKVSAGIFKSFKTCWIRASVVFKMPLEIIND
jgi:hypothetical protein